VGGLYHDHYQCGHLQPFKPFRLTSDSPTNRWSAVRRSLDAVKLRVLTIRGHQLIVGADLH
jgi:hypothetical protein